jgi:hypothetical protein
MKRAYLYQSIRDENNSLHVEFSLKQSKYFKMKNFYLLVIFILILGNNVHSQNISVPTQRYDNYRVGWNSKEKLLNTGNVNLDHFGLLFTRSVDDQMYSTPLLISNMSINGKAQNVLLVATMNNSVYAFDADDSSAMAPLWHVNVTSPGNRVFKSSDLPCSNYGPNIGIIGTPAIDTISKIMYFVSNEYSNTAQKAEQYFHALDITTGNEKVGSPTLINAFVLGTGDGSINDTVFFNPMKHNQRSAMLLHNGVVYICWASFCDLDPYHGWVMGFDATTYQLKYTYNNTPNGSEGGIWMQGNGPSVDDNGYIYIISGNGTVGVTGNPNDSSERGESLLKFKPDTGSLKLIDFFTPGDYAKLEQNDLDYGTGTAMLIPNSNLSVSTSKEGMIYLLDDSKLGKCTPSNDSAIQAFSIIPHFSNAQWADFGTPIYYPYMSQADSEFIYVWASFDSLKQFLFKRSLMQFELNKTIEGTVKAAQSNYGPVLAGSSDGNIPGTGIVWALRFTTNTNGTGLLEAYDALDVRKLLWSSNSGTGNKMGTYPKFNSPVIANGKVYVPSQSKKVYVYGLRNPFVSFSMTETRNKFLTAFPNPVEEFLNINYVLSTPEKNLYASFSDLSGKVLFKINLNGKVGENSETIHFGNKLQPGIYIAVIQSDMNMFGKFKLVKD